jgi:FkbM family methyltransferase
MIKKLFWMVLTYFLSAGTRLIRRKPSNLSPQAWRACRFSFSHYAEDLIVIQLLREKLSKGQHGIYVDVGAFDPILFSNTFLLHLHGWRGLNIDPNEDQINKFRAERPEDVNLVAVVSDGHRLVRYLQYPTGGTNRLVDLGDVPLENVAGEKPNRVIPMTTTTLTEVLSLHLPQGTQIDFLNIDCEGEDFAVLRGLDWDRWAPSVLAVEAYDDKARSEITAFVRERGYSPVAQALLTLIFVRTEELVTDLRIFA